VILSHLKNSEMTQIEKVSAAASEWIFKIAAGVLPKVNIPADSAIGKFMYGFIGVDPNSYNLWNELGFLAEPTIEVMVTPMIEKYLGGMSDEQIKSVAMKYADAMLQQVERKGSINLFGMELQRDAFVDLKRILTEKIGE
jgi:hypothetical protein